MSRMVFRAVGGQTALSPGTTCEVECLVSQRRWEVWTDGDGGVELRNENLVPVPEVYVTFSRTPNTGATFSLENGAYTDQTGRVVGEFTAGNSYSTLTASASVNGQNLSESLSFTNPYEFSFDRVESVREVTLGTIQGPTPMLPGETRNVEAVVTERRWEVWTNAVGDSEHRMHSAVPVAGASVTFQVTGNGFLSTGETAYTNEAGIVRATFTAQAPGTSEIIASIQASTDTVATSQLTLTIQSDTPEEIWTYDRTEGTLSAFLSGDASPIPAANSRTLRLAVVSASWEVWTSNLGNVRIEGYSEAGASEASVSWSVDAGDGSITGASTTDSLGYVDAWFTGGYHQSLVTASVTFGGATATATFQAESAESSYAGTTDPSWNSGTTDSSWNSGTTDSSWNSGTTDSSWNSGTTDSSWNSGTTDSSWNSGTTDSSWNTGTTDSSSNTVAEETWSYAGMQEKVTLSGVTVSGGGLDGLLTSEARTISGNAQVDRWDVFTGSYGNTDYRYVGSHPYGGAVSAAIVEGDGSVSSGIWASNGYFSFQFNMGSVATRLRVGEQGSGEEFYFDFTPAEVGGAEAAEAPVWELLRTESAYRVIVSETGGSLSDVSHGEHRMISGSVVLDSWEVWSPDGGMTLENRNAASQPASWRPLRLSVEYGSGVFRSGPENALGGRDFPLAVDATFSVLFEMGSDVTRVRLWVEDFEAGMPLTFTPPVEPPVETWTWHRNEAEILVNVVPESINWRYPGGVFEMPYSEIPVSVDITYNSWEIWRSNFHTEDNPREELRSYASGPAINAQVDLSVEGPGGGSADVNFHYTGSWSRVTNSTGHLPVIFRSGTGANRLTASVSYLGTTSSGAADFSRAPGMSDDPASGQTSDQGSDQGAGQTNDSGTSQGGEASPTNPPDEDPNAGWAYQYEERSLGINVEPDPHQADTFVLSVHRSVWEVWTRGAERQTRNESATPAIGAAVTVALAGGNGSLTPLATQADSEGKVRVSYAADAAFGVSVTVNYEGLSTTTTAPVEPTPEQAPAPEQTENPGPGPGPSDPPPQEAPNDGNTDFDRDGLTREEEENFGSDPSNPDTDGGGRDDGYEFTHGTDPKDWTDDEPEGGGREEEEEPEQPEEPEPYRITSVEATQTGGTAGVRKSSTVLKIVRPTTGNAAASLQAKAQGTRQEGEPTWTGNGVNGTAGSLSGNWTGSSTATATATASGGAGSVQIVIVEPDKGHFGLEADTASFKEVKDKLNGLISKVSRTGGFALEGTVDIDFDTVDLYNDGSRVGSKVEVEGSISGSIGNLEVETTIPTNVPGVFIEVGGGIDLKKASITGTGTCDESKAQPGDLTVTGAVEAGFSVHLGGYLGLPDGAKVIGIEGEAATTATGSWAASWEQPGLFVTPSFSAKPLTGTFEIYYELGPFKSEVAKGEKEWFGVANFTFAKRLVWPKPLR